MNPDSSIALSADNFPIYVALISACLACGLYAFLAIWTRGTETAHYAADGRGTETAHYAADGRGTETARYAADGDGMGREPGVGKLARVLYYVSTACVAGACIYLLQCILSGARYDIAYVSDHSSVFDSMAYRISALWAGQGGSLLLWATFAGIIGVFLVRKLERTSPVLMSFWCSVQAFFLVLMVVDDPFKKLIGYQPGGMGSGMNPLLKNPWMVIHPPVVFIAYALLAVPAALAVQAMVSGDVSRWAKRCLPWALGGWVAMTAGLVLGMIWSYEVLGWGGYWGWDPVENASLVPWLLCTALVHGLVLQRQRGSMIRWNVILAFVTFLAVLYATYLTRSGVTSQAVSVHSFDSGKEFRSLPIYAWLRWVPMGYGALCLGLLVARWNSLGSPKKAARIDSRDSAIGIGVIVLCLFAVVVLVGTTYTIFSPESKLDPSFYTVMSIPLATVMVLLISLSPLLSWGGGESGKGSRVLQVILVVLAVVAVVSAMASAGAAQISRIAAERNAFGHQLAFARVAFLISRGAVALLLACGAIAVVSSAIAGAKASLRRCGAYAAHAGMAVVILGVILSANGSSRVLDLSRGGQPGKALGYSFAYLGRERVSAEREIVRIAAERRGRRFETPLAIDGSSVLLPSIRSSVLGDLYIAPEKLLGVVVTPTMSMGEKDWIAHPRQIPASQAELALVGMQVEEHAATLQYMKPGMRPIEFMLRDGHPMTVDGYTFAFRGFTSNGERDMMKIVAGVNVGVEGRGQQDVAIIRVTTKPFIWLLWLGTVLIMIGGTLALVRRRSEKA